MMHIAGVSIPPEIEAKLGSPIERLFVEAFIGDHDVRVDGDRLWRGDFWLRPQAQVGIYWVDFVMGRSVGSLAVDVAIELDGHEFHHKTQEQVQYDRARDRSMIRAGVVALRFTGSEVNRSARACVAEVEQLLTMWLDRAVRRRSA